MPRPGLIARIETDSKSGKASSRILGVQENGIKVENVYLLLTDVIWSLAGQKLRRIYIYISSRSKMRLSLGVLMSGVAHVVVNAQTPPGFSPSTSVKVVVSFNSDKIVPGVQIAVDSKLAFLLFLRCEGGMAWHGRIAS